MFKTHLRILSGILGASLVLVSCGGGGGDGEGGQGGDGNMGGMGGAPVKPSACTGTIDPGPAIIRRLNRFEYNNTVKDLLGTGLRPADEFPVEEKPHGFDNNAEALTVSPLLSEQYMLASERLANDYLDRNFAMIATRFGCTGTSDPATPAGEDACARRAFQSLGRSGYRLPIPADELKVLMDVYAQGKASAATLGFRNGLRVGLMTLLQSPRFLYRVEMGMAPLEGEKVARLDPHETATRLSYLLWGTQPDGTLRTAADQNKLVTKEEIAAQVDRMLKDTRARTMVKRFHDEWLELDRIDNIDKDTKVFKNFTKGVIGPMGQETERFLDVVVWQGGGDFTSMLTAPYTYVEQSLAKFYGFTNYVSPIGGDGMPNGTIAKVDLDPVKTKRGGLLTQGTFMASLAGPNQSSPVKRGQFVREKLLCQTLPPPPPDLIVSLPPLDPKLTTRERFAQHDAIDGCKTCHMLMDPIGLGFEEFDGIAQLRTTEAGRPIDASGEVTGMSWDGKFMGALDLQKKLAASDEAQECLVRNWFRYGYGRTELDNVDDCSLERVRIQFQEGKLGIKQLLAALATTDAFLYRRVTPPGGAP